MSPAVRPSGVWDDNAYAGIVPACSLSIAAAGGEDAEGHVDPAPGGQVDVVGGGAGPGVAAAVRRQGGDAPEDGEDAAAQHQRPGEGDTTGEPGVPGPTGVLRGRCGAARAAGRGGPGGADVALRGAVRVAGRRGAGWGHTGVSFVDAWPGGPPVTVSSAARKSVTLSANSRVSASPMTTQPVGYGHRR